MSEYCDEIMHFSDIGCIDDPEKIEKITERVLLTRAADINVRGYYSPLEIANDLLYLNGLPVDKAADLRVCDLLALADESYCRERYALAIMMMLNEASSISYDIKLFLSISVKSLAELMDKKSGTFHCNEMFPKLTETAYSSVKVKTDGKTTIKQLISGAARYMAWGARNDIDDFIEHMEKNCVVMTYIVKFMFSGYSELLDSEKLIKAIFPDYVPNAETFGEPDYFGKGKFGYFEEPNNGHTDDNDFDIDPLDEDSEFLDFYTPPNDSGTAGKTVTDEKREDMCGEETEKKKVPEWDEVVELIRRVAEKQRKSA